MVSHCMTIYFQNQWFPNIPGGDWPDSNYVCNAFGIEYFKKKN